MKQNFQKEFTSIPTVIKMSDEAVSNKEKVNLLASQFEQVHNIDLTNNIEEQNKISEKVQNDLSTCSNEKWENIQ